MVKTASSFYLSSLVYRQSIRRSLHSTSSETTTLLVSNFYPDVTASAAGVRSKYLLDQLSLCNRLKFIVAKHENDKVLDKEVKSGCPQEIINTLREERNIDVIHLPPNRSESMKDFCSSNPKINTIIFDRFYTEENFSFAFLGEYKAAASMVLDMQDMHSLRAGRQRIVKEFDKHCNIYGDDVDPFESMNQVLDYIPSADDPHLLRELASIHRSDLTLVCSPSELELLQSTYSVAPSKLCLAPFFVDKHLPAIIKEKLLTSQSEQIHNKSNDSPTDFVFCGGFKHAPNLDAARLLIRFIWPKINRQLPPGSTLHIYGAHCPSELHQAHNPKGLGLYVHGYTPRLDDVFLPANNKNKRILLAPLRFGAGIKGKIIDAWSFGMPVVTTPIGSEGIINHNDKDAKFGGSIASSLENFCEQVLTLSLDLNRYQEAQSRGYYLLEKLYDGENNWKRVQDSLSETRQNLHSRRSSDYVRAMLWHHSAQSTKYFSKWIEVKEQSQKETS